MEMKYRLNIKPEDIGLEPIAEDEVFVVCTTPPVKLGMYLISNYGRVYSNCSKSLMKLKCNKAGYLIVTLQIDRFLDAKRRYSRQFRVHRLVAFEFCYRDSWDKDEVDHLNSKPSDNYYKNLEWVTGQENTRRIAERGRNYNHKTEGFIRYLCEKMEKGETIFDIYYEFHPDEIKTYRNFEDRKFYKRLYLLATDQRNHVIRNQYNIDIEKVYPRYNKKIKKEQIETIERMIKHGYSNMEIMSTFGYYTKSSNTSLYRFICKHRKAQRLSKG